MGRLTAKDKVHLAKLKLRGQAKIFYTAQSELRADDVTYATFRTAFVNRFKDKHTDQYHYSTLQTASQEKDESPEVCLDRLRKLCQRTIRRSDNAVEQAVINLEADRRLLAAFISGLIGTPGKHVRLQMPEKIDTALNMAIIATNAEKEEKALAREDRGANTKVFTVGGNRNDALGNRDRDRKPRGKFQWSGNRGAGGSYHGIGTYSTREDGTNSGRNDYRTPLQSDVKGRTKGGGAESGPKNDDDRCAPRRPYDIRCFNCGLKGHIRRDCPRGQSLNGIGRTKATPSSNPK